MGRFHYHADGTGHSHDDGEHDHEHDHDHDHDHGWRRRPFADTRPAGCASRCSNESWARTIAPRKPTAATSTRLGVHVVNLMSSPGAGKTTLLREVLLKLGSSVRVGIVEGDVETSIDADRLAGLGAPVSLVNTANGFGGECHLDATMVRSALPRLPLADLDVVVIENVGNLVCPAEFDVGEDARAMVFSVTEGEEKPLKYPVMFRSADVVIINKIDLLPHLDFDLDLFRANLRDVNPDVRTIETSAKTGAGVDEVCAWIASLVDHS